MPAVLLISGLVLYLLVIGVVLWRMLEFRRGISYPPSVSLSTIIGSRNLIKQIYILLILLGHQLVKFFKFFIIKVEKRFAKVVNQIKGKGEISQKGAVSLFLKEIKDHQIQVKKEGISQV